MELVKKIYDILAGYSKDFTSGGHHYRFEKYRDFELDFSQLREDFKRDVSISEYLENRPSDILLWKIQMRDFDEKFKELQRPSGTALGMPYVDNSFYNEYQRLMTEANNLINKYGVEQLC
jgi:hypothetical protein